MSDIKLGKLIWKLEESIRIIDQDMIRIRNRIMIMIMIREVKRNDTI